LIKKVSESKKSMMLMVKGGLEPPTPAL
jgi:hypothetical protein